MQIFKLKDMKGGWLIGDFEPSILRTQDFEVACVKHTKGDNWPVHYHKEATEINVMIKGKMRIQDTILTEGDIFVIKPYEVADPVFLEDCEVVCIKTPSCPGDKYIVQS